MYCIIYNSYCAWTKTVISFLFIFANFKKRKLKLELATLKQQLEDIQLVNTTSEPPKLAPRSESAAASVRQTTSEETAVLTSKTKNRRTEAVLKDSYDRRTLSAITKVKDGDDGESRIGHALGASVAPTNRAEAVAVCAKSGSEAELGKKSEKKAEHFAANNLDVNLSFAGGEEGKENTSQEVVFKSTRRKRKMSSEDSPTSPSR